MMSSSFRNNGLRKRGSGGSVQFQCADGQNEQFGIGPDEDDQHDDVQIMNRSLPVIDNNQH